MGQGMSDKEDYDGPDRRSNTHIEDQLKQIIDKMERLCGAFPVVDGKADLDGHRRAHEAQIRAARAEEDFWKEMKLDLAKKGAWGLLIILLGLVMGGLSLKLGLAGGIVK